MPDCEARQHVRTERVEEARHHRQRRRGTYSRQTEHSGPRSADGGHHQPLADDERTERHREQPQKGAQWRVARNLRAEAEGAPRKRGVGNHGTIELKQRSARQPGTDDDHRHHERDSGHHEHRCCRGRREGSQVGVLVLDVRLVHLVRRSGFARRVSLVGEGKCTRALYTRSALRHTNGYKAGKAY